MARDSSEHLGYISEQKIPFLPQRVSVLVGKADNELINAIEKRKERKGAGVQGERRLQY